MYRQTQEAMIEEIRIVQACRKFQWRLTRWRVMSELKLPTIMPNRVNALVNASGED